MTQDTRNLDLEDALDDIAVGYRLWEEAKMTDMSWDSKDEAFARWLKCSVPGDRFGALS